MYACLGEVRRELQETISRLKRDIPGIRLATIAHGDYCDASSSYVTKGGGLNGMNENYNLTCESHIFFYTLARRVRSTYASDKKVCVVFSIHILT